MPSSSEQKISSGILLVVEDHPIFVQALMQLISHHYPGLTVKVAPTCTSACDWLRGLQAQDYPIALLCDLGLPDLEGLAVLQRFVALVTCPIIVVSAEQDDDVLKQVRRLGATAFVSKRSDTDALVNALAAVLGPVHQPAVPKQPGRLASEHLSASQVRVARLLVQGHPNKEIARILDVAPDTVKTHVRDIMAKLDARNRTEAVLKLLQVHP